MLVYNTSGDRLVLGSEWFINYKTGCVWHYVNFDVVTNNIFNLRNFPFDRQRFRLSMADSTSGCKFIQSTRGWGTDSSSMPEHFGDDEVSNCEFWLQGETQSWMLHDVTVVPSAQPESASGSITCTAYLQRKPKYYLTSIVLVSYLICAPAASQCLMDFDDIPDRLMLIVTLMLTLVAFKFVTMSISPPTAYLTWLDKYIVSSFAFLMVNLLQNVAVKFAFDDEPHYWQIDQAVSMTLFALWTILHVYIVIGTKRNHFRESWDGIQGKVKNKIFKMFNSEADQKAD